MEYHKAQVTRLTNSDLFDTYHGGRSEFKFPVGSVSGSNLTHVVPACYFNLLSEYFVKTVTILKFKAYFFNAMMQ